MTDNEIIKALDCCVDGGMCHNCAFDEVSLNIRDCMDALVKKSLDLINRQQAEIERLKEDNEKQRFVIESIDDQMFPLPFEINYDKVIKTTKSEAIKEFWNELKARNTMDKRIISVKSGDNLAKEMTEE